MQAERVFLQSEFNRVASFRDKTESVDYQALYNAVPESSIIRMQVRPFSISNFRDFEIVSLDIRKDESEVIQHPVAPPVIIPNMAQQPKSASISCGLEQQRDIFSDFLGDSTVDTSLILSSAIDVGKSPPRKKPRLDGLLSNINDEEKENKNDNDDNHNIQNDNDDNHNIENDVNDNTYDVEQKVYIIEIMEHSEENIVFESEILRLWCSGNVKIAVNYQLGKNGKCNGNVLLVDCMRNGQHQLGHVEIPLIQHMMHKPADAFSKISYAVAHQIGSHATLSSEKCDLMTMYLKYYLINQITAAEETLFKVCGPGGYNIVTNNGDVQRIGVYANKDIVINFTTGSVNHPWKCGVYLDFEPKAGDPKIVLGQVNEPLPQHIQNDFGRMYSKKERGQFCKMLGMNNIGVTMPQIFRNNGGINPGLHLFSGPDRGKSYFVRYLLSACGCPSIEGINPELIMGNYTEAHIQKRADEMPGFIMVLEDTDRDAGNKGNISMTKLVWLLAEVNSNSTITHGTRQGATGGYITTGNVDLSFITDPGTQSRITVDGFEAPIVKENALVKSEMIAKAAEIHMELAKRTQYIVLNSQPSNKIVKFSRQMIIKLERIITETPENEKLKKYWHSRTSLLHVQLLSQTINNNRLLFDASDENIIVKEYMNGIKWFLDLCYKVTENPLQHAMRYSFEMYLRYLIFSLQCCSVDNKLVQKMIENTNDESQLDLLVKIQKCITILSGSKSVIIKENFIGVRDKVVQSCTSITIRFSDVTNLTASIASYYLQYVMDSVQNESIDFLSILSSCWKDPLLDIDMISKKKFMVLNDLKLFIDLANKNGKTIKEGRYKTKRALGYRYYSMILPVSLSKYVAGLKCVKKQNSKNKNKNNNDALNGQLTNEMKIQSIFNSILLSSACDAFRKPVDIALYPDYLNVISNPIDLKIISNKTYNGNVNLFCDDIKLMCYNAMQFNQPDTEIYKNSQIILNIMCNAILNISGCGANISYNNNSNNNSNNNNNNELANINFDTN